MKKQYITPETEVITIQSHMTLLAGSVTDINNSFDENDIQLTPGFEMEDIIFREDATILL